LRPNTKAYDAARYARGRETKIAAAKARWQRIKHEVLTAYGGKCACCGQTRAIFLCIDHINGKGHEHLRQIGTRGIGLYEWLKREGFPSGFQVLCHNCNHAKGTSDRCPCGE
jgi:hypothetical protein